MLTFLNITLGGLDLLTYRVYILPRALLSPPPKDHYRTRHLHFSENLGQSPRKDLFQKLPVLLQIANVHITLAMLPIQRPLPVFSSTIVPSLQTLRG